MATELNDRQIRFVHYVLEGATHHEAWCRATGRDYSQLTPSQRSSVRSHVSRLLKNPQIKAMVNSGRQRMVEASDIKKEDILTLLVKVIYGEDVTDRQEQTVSEANGTTTKTYSMSKQWAIDRLCRILGFNEAQRMDVNIGTQQSREELEEELRRLEGLE